MLLAAQHGNLSFIKRILSLGNVLTHPGTQQSILHTMAACPTSAQPQHSFTAAKIVQTLVKAGARCVYAQQHLL
jgi:ferritin-like protein